jgi:hypothetical protein
MNKSLRQLSMVHTGILISMVVCATLKAHPMVAHALFVKEFVALTC